MDKNGKSRHSVWLSDDVWQEVDAFYKLDNCPTRNEFVEKALRQYCGRCTLRGQVHICLAHCKRCWRVRWVCSVTGWAGCYLAGGGTQHDQPPAGWRCGYDP